LLLTEDEGYGLRGCEVCDCREWPWIWT